MSDSIPVRAPDAIPVSGRPVVIVPTETFSVEVRARFKPVTYSAITSFEDGGPWHASLTGKLLVGDVELAIDEEDLRKVHVQAASREEAVSELERKVHDLVFETFLRLGRAGATHLAHAMLAEEE